MTQHNGKRHKSIINITETTHHEGDKGTYNV